MKKIEIKNPKLFFIGIVAAILIVVFDLFTKFLILNNFELGEAVRLTPFFNLVLVFNRGVSFGMFNSIDNSVFILSGLAIIISLFLIYWMTNIDKKGEAIALGLIIGGAYGNTIDRIINGAVVDFLDFYIKNYHWPAFNVADSAISLGAIYLIIDEIFLRKKAK